MKRSIPLRVELLEDRCVPTVDTTTSLLLDPTTTTTDSYVIDPPLIDPNAAPAPSDTTTDTQPLPTDLIPPITSPIWF